MFFITGLVATTAQEADYVPQGNRREEHRKPAIWRRNLLYLRDRQICPVPRNRDQSSDAKSHQYPRFSLAPEDPFDATRLAAIYTIF